MFLRRSLSSLAALLLGVGSVAAQTEAPPPHLSVLDGRAEITRGQDREAAVANTPLVLGDQLATSDGRAEVLLGDGSALHLDAQTTLDFNGDSVVRLSTGRLIVAGRRGRRRQPADRRRSGLGARAVVGGSAPGAVCRRAARPCCRSPSCEGWSTSTAAARRCRCRPASRCLSAKARRRAIRARSTPRDSMASRAGRRNCSMAGAARRPRSTSPPTCASTDRRSISTDRGTTRRPTATSGIHAWSRRGGRTTTDAGATRGGMAGRSSPAIPGAGRHTTTDAGD